MNVGLIIGLAAGIPVAGTAAYLALRARGYFQYLGGAKRSSIPPVNKETLMGRLLDLNDLSQPFSIIEGKETDMVVEWKPVSPLLDSGNSESRAYRAHLLLDQSRHAVRCYEEIGMVSWEKTVDGLRPIVTYRRPFLGGLAARRKKGSGLKKDRHLDLEKIKSPLLAMVRENGWEWVPVTALRHAAYRKRQPG